MTCLPERLVEGVARTLTLRRQTPSLRASRTGIMQVGCALRLFSIEEMIPVRLAYLGLEGEGMVLETTDCFGLLFTVE